MPDRINLEASRLPQPIAASGIRILAPGLRGRLTYYGARTVFQVRGETAEASYLDQALSEAGLEDRHTIDIEAATPPVSEAGETRGEGGIAESQVQLEIPGGENEVQFAIYQDENRVVSFHFPEKPPAGESLTRRADGFATVVYRIQLRQPAEAGPEAGETRGIVSTLAHKVIKIIVGKVLQGVVGLVEFAAVKLWEKTARRFEGFHSGALSQFLSETPNKFHDWKMLDGQRALLFIHGTTSTTSGAFDGLKSFPSVTQRIWTYYNNRVLGFNHHTLTKSVAENVIDFYGALAANPGTYTFDVVTHSRGGLVARAIAELSDDEISQLAKMKWTRPAGVCVRFDRIVFVGTPNNGTDLADPKNIPVVLDRLANIIEMLPDAPLTIALGSILATAAYVSETGLAALPGLVDMELMDSGEASTFLTNLNAPNKQPINLNAYFGVQADFCPSGGLASALLDKGVDKLFREKPNDLVVPTLGVSIVDSLDLPAPQVKKYGQTDGIQHTSYFRHAATWDHITVALNVPPLVGASNAN